MAGKKGTTKARIHSVFKNRLKELQARAQNAADGFARAKQRTWQLPPGWIEKDLFNLAELHKPDFDRTDMNTNYVECMQSAEAAGTTGDVASLKQQIDYNAMEERALRMRHASTVRQLVHSGARQNGHAVSQTFPGIELQAADMIKAGAL